MNLKRLASLSLKLTTLHNFELSCVSSLNPDITDCYDCACINDRRSTIDSFCVRWERLQWQRSELKLSSISLPFCRIKPLIDFSSISPNQHFHDHHRHRSCHIAAPLIECAIIVKKDSTKIRNTIPECRALRFEGHRDVSYGLTETCCVGVLSVGRGCSLKAEQHSEKDMSLTIGEYRIGSKFEAPAQKQLPSY